MSIKKIFGVVSLVLSGLFLVGALRAIMGGPAPAGQASANAGYYVGLFLPCVVTLIIGLYLMQKSNSD